MVGSLMSTSGVKEREGKIESRARAGTDIDAVIDCQVQLVDGVARRRAGEGWTTALTNGSCRKPTSGAQ